MKKILLVDDDPVVLKTYQTGLSRDGVQVQTAANGTSALNSLRTARPDVAVIDLMMPVPSGVEVLKFIRQEPGLKDMPVVVLSNSFMNGLAAEASALGVQKRLLKARCSPSVLLEEIDEVLARKHGAKPAPPMPAVPRSAPPPPPASRKNGTAPTAAPPPAQRPSGDSTTEFHADARRAFLHNAPATCASLRALCQGVITAAGQTSRGLRLQGLYREVNSLAANAGMAQCNQLAQMANAFEAMLLELLNRPEYVNASVLRTVATTVDLIALLFDCARDAELDVPLSAQALIVDDDAMNTRLMESALQSAQISVASAQDGNTALQQLQQTHHDLVLLDVGLADMDGFEVCRRLRKLPGYQKTPVLFVTINTDFETRAQSVLSGGNDVIYKPVFPLELTVKAVAHLLRSALPA